MRISWRILNVPNKGFQRILKPLYTPAGNISWYKKWYEIPPSFGVLPTYDKTQHASDAAVLTEKAYRPRISKVCIYHCLKPYPDISAFLANETEQGRGSFRQRFSPFRSLFTPPRQVNCGVKAWDAA